MTIPKIEKIVNIWEDFEKKREQFFDITGKAIRTTKKHQLALFKKKFDRAEELLNQIKDYRNQYLKIVEEVPFLRRMDKFAIAEQEFVESYLLHHYLKNNELLDFEYFLDNYNVYFTDYLAGLIDFLGELKRLFLEKLARNELKEAEKLKEFVEGVYLDLLEINLKLADLRNKVDSLRYLLKSMEEALLYYKIKTLQTN